MHLTLRQIQLFETVARLGSFTRAAEELGLTQPAVSLQIRQMEDQAGTPLFDRIGKKIYLTAPGKACLAAARDIQQRLQSLSREMAEMQGTVKGTLTLAAVTTVQYVAPHLLAAFRQRYPAVEVKLSVTNRERVLDQLNNNEADVILMGQVPEQLPVSTVAFLKNPLLLVAAPDHPLAKARRLSLQDLAGEDWILREQGSGTRRAMERAFKDQKVKLRPSFELGSNEAIKQAVKAGLGCSMLSWHTMAQEVADGHLATLDVQGFPQVRTWYAAYQKGKQLTLAAERFLEFLEQEGDAVTAQWEGGLPL